MAAGEYVSVSSQADTEAADIARERAELTDDPDSEQQELAEIYIARGVEPETAKIVAAQMMAHDALASPTRDELHITATTTARPVLAAFASAGTFTAGAILPVLLAALLPIALIVAGTAVGSILFLALLGALGAKTGGAPIAKPVLRVVFWGALAMLLTAGIGRLVGTAV
ncbi:Predicted Fe2+/Mn2+ transporter, VIT1/CCC1 family [Novosphingobium sp. B1]|nr:Predicted Fe2+/Mn2+ transporter, VIT1/CCC1 family [Novosphingobium sp. B1]